MGLSICRELVDLHGGDISAESEPGKGSQFTVTLPVEIGRDRSAENVQKPAAKTMDPKADPSPGKEFCDIHILVAEDNVVNQMVLSRWLEKRGVSHEIQGDGAQVLTRLTAPKPDDPDVDVILMDIQMPIIGGLEATQKIRSLDDIELAKLPIIALTANAMAGQGEEYVAAGMDGYMSKPIDFEIPACPSAEDQCCRFFKHKIPKVKLAVPLATVSSQHAILAESLFSRPAAFACCVGSADDHAQLSPT